jgi:hypothetical protein
MRYKIYTTVKSIEWLKRVMRGRMVGGSSVLEEEDLGWFVCFEGSWERLHVGDVQPTFKVGQKVEITIEGK